MGEKGWIRIDRRILDHELWKDKPFSKGQAWLDLILLASFAPEKVLFKNQIVDLQPGDLLISERMLMKRWGWGNTKTRGFLALLEREKMIAKKQSTEQSNSQSVITIVNWGVYQIAQSARQSANQSMTKAQPKRNQSAQDKDLIISNIQNNETIEQYNNIEGDINNNINNIYTPLPAPAEVVKPIPDTGMSDLEQITEAWNAIPHVVKIRSIIPMTRRYDELRVVSAMVGMEGILKAIQSVKDSEWMRNKGHISFDSFIANRNAIQKVLEGSYEKDFETERRPKSTQTKFNSFSQRQYDFKELEKALMNK